MCVFGDSRSTPGVEAWSISYSFVDRGIIGRMRFRNLRIAFSVMWGIVAVLLVVFWVRSYLV